MSCREKSRYVGSGIITVGKPKTPVWRRRKKSHLTKLNNLLDNQLSNSNSIIKILDDDNCKNLPNKLNLLYSSTISKSYAASFTDFVELTRDFVKLFRIDRIDGGLNWGDNFIKFSFNSSSKGSLIYSR